MRDEERIARALHDRLRAAVTADITLKGSGVHWSLELVAGPRRCTISCFWYGAAAALMLGMNPANTRSTLRPSRQPHTGAEYLIELYDADTRIAGGRARDETAAADSVAAWLRGDSIAELEQNWPYVDATRRRLRRLLAPIEARCGDVARCVIETDRLYQLWIYGDGRSCQIHASDDSVGCAYRLGPVQVAYATATSDPAAAVDRWMRGATLAELAAAGATLEPHAELIERGDAARWHWLHTRDRIADPDDVLAESRPLLERLAGSAIATRFFSYSSLNRFCFSASSHYPWVDRGLPIIYPPPPSRGYFVEIGGTRTEHTIEQAVALVEATLAAYPVQPFFGSAVNLAIDPLNAELTAQRSTLRASLVQRHEWFRAVVANGDRRCTVDDSLRSVTFRDATDEYATAQFATLADTVGAIRRWLEERYTLDELRLDPTARDARVYRDHVAPD